MKHGIETQSFMFKDTQLCGAGIGWAFPCLASLPPESTLQRHGEHQVCCVLVHTLWALNDSL